VACCRVTFTFTLLSTSSSVAFECDCMWQFCWYLVACGSVWMSAYGSVLWFAEVRGIMNRRHVQEGYDQVQQALLDYTVNCYPQIQVTYSSICWVVLKLSMSTKGITLQCTDISWLNASVFLTVLYTFCKWPKRSKRNGNVCLKENE
jgi:hypothetical protein